jgi:hypothetical protein
MQLRVMVLIVCLNSSMGSLTAFAQADPYSLSWGLEKIAGGIVSHLGAEVWNEFTGQLSDEELHRRTVQEIAAIIQTEFHKARLEQALSHFQNADRELKYYLNNPTENVNSLDEARTQSGFAMYEFEKLGPQALGLYTKCATLHMAILHEKVKRSSNPRLEQKNVDLHAESFERSINGFTSQIVKQMDWDEKTWSPRQRSAPTSSLNLALPDAVGYAIRTQLHQSHFVSLAFTDPMKAAQVLENEPHKISGSLAIPKDFDVKTLKGIPPNVFPPMIN